MNATRALLRFARSDPSHAPFGSHLLRGLTPVRVALVAAICFLFALQGAGRDLLQDPDYDLVNMVTDLFIGTTQMLLYIFPAIVLVTVADNLSARARTSARVASLTGAVVCGAAIYATLFFGCDAECRTRVGGLRIWLGNFAELLSWGGLLTGALFFLERERRVAAATQQAALDRVDLDRQMAEARLQMLQAQIEPHFLFNSLATVQSLYRQDPLKGKRLIRDLLAYLRGALPHMREPASTLRREFALCEAYLRVLQVRMGERLRVEIDVPPSLAEASVPPMMLPTLIENAIKHGIAPLPNGGTVRIRAEASGDRLRIAVSDTGAGFRHTSGAGIGLDNTRARLASLYGRAATLSVVANAGPGVTASLEFPLQAASGSRHAD